MFSIFNLKTNKTLSNFDFLNSKLYTYEISSMKIVENNENNDLVMKIIKSGEGMWGRSPYRSLLIL